MWFGFTSYYPRIQASIHTNLRFFAFHFKIDRRLSVPYNLEHIHGSIHAVNYTVDTVVADLEHCVSEAMRSLSVQNHSGVGLLAHAQGDLPFL